jgi:hypothetical protein
MTSSLAKQAPACASESDSVSNKCGSAAMHVVKFCATISTILQQLKLLYCIEGSHTPRSA